MKNNLDIRLLKIKVVLPSGKTLFSIPELTIPFGSHVLIQGESGRGKTTLLHLMAGLFSPQQGEVSIGGMHLNLMNDNHLCELRQEKIGVIFQKLNLIEHLTVAENISLSLTRRTTDKQSLVDDAIKQVNLEEHGHDRCSFLSLGEQQRVAVARVLAQNPAIILADEPTSSLDDKNTEFVLSSLKKAAKEKTLIVVSHDRRISSRFERVIAFEEFCP
jgi:ABC-type lipoprotein export system ATPase subunit